jgi:hypothetical protein
LNKPTPTPVTSATPSPTATPKPTPTATSGPAATPAPALTVPAITQVSNNVNISLGINNITDVDQVYGVEVHVVYSNASLNIVPISNSSFDSHFFGAGSVTRFDNNIGSTKNDIIFAAVLPKPFSIPSSPILVNLKLKYIAGTTTNRTFEIYVKVVHKNGSFTINTLNSITFQPTVVGDPS